MSLNNQTGDPAMGELMIALGTSLTYRFTTSRSSLSQGIATSRLGVGIERQRCSNSSQQADTARHTQKITSPSTFMLRSASIQATDPLS